MAGAVVDAVRVDVSELGKSTLLGVIALAPREEEAVVRAGLVEHCICRV